MRTRTQEESAIDAVLASINRAAGTSYNVVQRPDQANREAKDIDAYAEDAGAPSLAIEHTRLETFEGQTRDDAWFMQGLGSLEGTPLPCLLRLYPPHANVVPGQDWDDICARIRSWAIEGAGSLPEGVARYEVVGVPFPVLVEKVSGSMRGLRIGRMEPLGDRAEQLLAMMHVALNHKAEALVRYRCEGAVAVLVLTSEDIALTNEASIYRAFVRATREQPRPWLDQVWLARTVTSEQPYCLTGSDDLMAAINPPNFCFGRQYAEMWLRESRHGRS